MTLQERPKITKEWLEKWYVSRRLSTWAIEKQFGYGRSAVYKKLGEYKIPRRSLSDSHLKSARKPFDGSAEERAYMFGFTVGDLRVRRHNKGNHCETISIACSSTNPAQIELIRGLFAPYGHIWQGIANERGVVSIEAFVDFSFSFLLGKNWHTHTSFWDTDKTFLAFLSGFTDAEGYISVATGKAKLGWGNYDEKLLRYLKERLEEMGMLMSSVTCDNLKGYVGKDGYVRQANYYSLSCNRKASLKPLLSRMAVLLRHKDKQESLQRALSNIDYRNKKYGYK